MLLLSKFLSHTFHCLQIVILTVAVANSDTPPDYEEAYIRALTMVPNRTMSITIRKGGGGGHGGGSAGHGSSGGRGSGTRSAPASKPAPAPVPDVPAPRPAPAPAPVPARAPSPGLQNPYSENPGRPLAKGLPKGKVVPPKKRTRGKAPEEEESDDPSDDALDSLHFFAGMFIHDHNPCANYQEGLKSNKNKKRKKGCRHEKKRLKKALQVTPSTNCPDPVEARCFQLSGQAGRCYVLVNTPQSASNYVLIDKCRPVEGATPTVAPPQPQPQPQPSPQPQPVTPPAAPPPIPAT